ncbi:OB-fold protein [Aliarcobacter lanthieri]|uniref:OB-fold protein n=1 Tax=Aliarcobacter lanthieri TaxID=1355374 RepID=UPI003AAFD990
MALVKCKECDKEISSTVKVCPHCGYKKKMSFKKFFLISLILGIILGLILSNSNKDSGSSTASKLAGNSSDKVERQSKNLFNDLELNIFKILIEDEIEGVINNDDTMIVSSGILKLPTSITVDKLQREYVKNEVKADEQYKNKILLVSGKIDSIQKDAFNNMNLKLIGGDNMFLYPTAQVEDKYTGWVASLNKGNNVKLVCKNKGFIISMVQLGDCSPFDGWVKEQNIASKILKSYKENENEKVGKMIEFIKLVSSKLDTNKSFCSSQNLDSDKCIKEINSIAKELKTNK